VAGTIARMLRCGEGLRLVGQSCAEASPALTAAQEDSLRDWRIGS
jgi:hypothetical protein